MNRAHNYMVAPAKDAEMQSYSGVQLRTNEKTPIKRDLCNFKSMAVDQNYLPPAEDGDTHEVQHHQEIVHGRFDGWGNFG